MKISASIYSNKSKTIVELVNELDRFHIDYIHIDCNDESLVMSVVGLQSSLIANRFFGE